MKDSTDAIDASITSPSAGWVELNIEGVPAGAVAVDVVDGHPQLVFEVSEDDVQNIEKVHSEAGEPHGTALFKAPLPVTMEGPEPAVEDGTERGQRSGEAHVPTPDSPAPPEKLLPFRWFGGKYSSLEFIREHLPHRKVYVEPFGGSGTVLLNRSPAEVEILNDYDAEVIHFFEVLRTQTEELLESIALTPFSREELARAVELTKSPPADMSDLELARLFFIKASQTRTGLAQQATAGRWAYCSSMSRQGMAGNVSRYWGRLAHLPAVADRLRQVQLESKDARDLVADHVDNPDALIYCDPPYPHQTRTDTNAYQYEFTERDHRELADTLTEADADVAISTYECDLYASLYGNAGWHKTVGETKRLPSGDGKTEAEVLWTNYDPDSIDGENPQTGLGEF